MFSSDTKYFLKLWLSQNKIIKNLAGRILLLLATLALAKREHYYFSRILGKYEKLSEAEIALNHTPKKYKDLREARAALIDSKRSTNAIYESFLRSKKAKSIELLYKNFSREDAAKIRYRNEDDENREGNLLILKKPEINQDETIAKGVLYLQYNNSLYEFARLYDLAKVYERYTLVFEPSSWGYSDLGLELLLHGQNKVFVMAQDQIDFEITAQLDPRLIPIRAGAGDWINLDALTGSQSDANKVFDVCMVASWRKLKNHKLLFQQLSKLGKGLRIALIGYCWENRTAASIRAEQNKYFPDSLVSIFESVPHEYVFRVLAESKVALMLSEREGANRGIYEAVASNVPVVMLSKNRGVNKDLISEGCVFPANEATLAHTVKNLLEKPLHYSVSEKLLNISGTVNTWKKIDRTLVKSNLTGLAEEPLITSTPNLKYRNVEVKNGMEITYKLLTEMLHKA